MNGQLTKSRLSLTDRARKAAIAFMAVLISIAMQPVALHAADWVKGDVFVGVGGGLYLVYSSSGVFKETIDNGLGGFTTGCGFNPGMTRLYTTAFSTSQAVAFNDPHPHTIAQTINTEGGAGSESIAFAANGDFYVGGGGGFAIQKSNSSGVFLQAFSVGGADWIELAADQCTIFYTAEGTTIRRFDVCTNTQLADFATGLPGPAYALRLLPDGGVLVASSEAIRRLDASGMIVQTYDAPGEDSWFALNLDPNGTSFWSGDFGTSNFYRFNIATGEVEVGPVHVENATFLGGICLKGEITVAAPALVNDSVSFNPIRSTFSTTPATTACPGGEFSFRAKLTNTSAKSISDLVVDVTALTNGNLLKNADGGPGGVGAPLTVPKTGAYSDGVLGPNESVDVLFVICLQSRNPFSFFVNVLGVAF